MKPVRFYDIDWDTDGDDDADLPRDVVVLMDDDRDLAEDGADILADTFAFCVKRANDEALVDGSRLLSAYRTLKNVRIWIITEATDDDGKRAATTILLPEQY